MSGKGATANLPSPGQVSWDHNREGGRGAQTQIWMVVSCAVPLPSRRAPDQCSFLWGRGEEVGDSCAVPLLSGCRSPRVLTESVRYRWSPASCVEGPGLPSGSTQTTAGTGRVWDRQGAEPQLRARKPLATPQEKHSMVSCFTAEFEEKEIFILHSTRNSHITRCKFYMNFGVKM